LFCIGERSYATDPVGNNTSQEDSQKKEDKDTAPPKPSYHNIVSTVQKFFEKGEKSIEMKIAQNLLYVKNNSMQPEEFYHRLSEMDLPQGKEARHMLQKVKKDLHNQLGQEGVDYILGKKNSQGGSTVEAKLLGYRHETFMKSVKKISLEFRGRTTKNGHKFKLFFAEIGSWSSTKAEGLTFDMDIDACILSGDLALAFEMKKAIEADLKTHVRLSAEAFDTPVTAHGLAEHEVYLGKHGQAFAEDYIKTKKVYEIKDGQLKNGEGEGINGKLALMEVVLDRKFADVKIPDLINVKHPTEPGTSLEMIRHFEQDIKNQNIAGDIDSFIKAAKYLERSFDALQKEFGIAPGSIKNSLVNTKTLSSFVDQLIAIKEGRLPDVEPVDIIKQYFKDIKQEIPFDIKLGSENTKGLSEIQIKTKETIIKQFWDDCNHVMWDNAVKGFELNYEKIKKFMNPKDQFTAKKHNLTIKKLYEMMNIENVVMHDSHIGVKTVPPQFEKLMKQFDTEYKAYTSKWGLEILDDQAKAQLEFIKKNIEVSSKNSRNKNIDFAVASLTSLANAPLKLNGYLDILDDTLMDDLHTGEWKTYLAEARSATLGQKVETYLAGTKFEKKWKDVHQGKFKRFLDKSGQMYVKAESSLNSMLLDNYAARGITNINKQFSQALESSKGAQGAMTAMALISLKDELPVYYTALADGDWEKFAVEFFRRRVPGSGTVENIVMGQYYSAAWDSVTTLLPPVALVNSIYAISNDLGNKAWKTVWTEELNLFIDELYANSVFAISETVKHGYDLEITKWTLKTTEYRQTKIDMAQELEKMGEEVKEMDIWWSKYAKVDPNKRTESFPSHKYQDNLANWMKVNEMLWLNIRANDNVLMYLDEVSKNYKLGEVTDLYYVYMRQIRWAKVKLQFLYHLKKELEKRRETEKIVLDGNDQKILEELMSIASKLGIKDEVEENFKNEVGGDIWEIYSNVRDWFHGVKREQLWEPKIWEEYKEKIKISATYLQTYKTIWDTRKELETLFSMEKEDKEQIRILTGPDFLTGNPKKDDAIVNEWKEDIKNVYRETQGKLRTIKAKYVENDLNLTQNSFDYNMLLGITSAQIVKKLYTWAFRHNKGDKRTLFNERAKILEARKEALFKQFENYYRVLDTKKLDQIEKDLNQAKNLSEEAQKKCNESKKAATDISKALKEDEKTLVLLESSLEKLSTQTKELKNNHEEIKKDHSKMEKNAAKVVEITHELETLSLKICEMTNGLNDSTTTDARHDQNYDWIKRQKNELRQLLVSAKQMVKDADLAYEKSKTMAKNGLSLDKKTRSGVDEGIKRQTAVSAENKKAIDTASLSLLTGKNQTAGSKSLKESSQTTLLDLEKQFAGLLDTDSSEKVKKRIHDLKKKAGTINIDDCPKEVAASLESVTKTWEEREKRVKKISALYEGVKKGFDENSKTIEALDQSYQNMAYLIDLSKAYVERANTAAVDGAFCTVLADGIMERVFPPDVKGLKLENANSILEKKGFGVAKTSLGKPPSAGESEVVETQNPGRTKRLAKGTTITLSHYDKLMDKDSRLAETDCSRWPGSQAVWDTPNNKPGCGCVGDTVWDAARTRCISQKEAALASANCSFYPNTRPVWDDIQGRVMCDCLPGAAWNSDRSACIGQKQLALETVDCSQYPGSIAAWDDQGNKPACKCPDGTQWIKQLNRCISKQEAAMANADCSRLPGSAPRWNYVTEQVECACQSPYTLDYTTGKCVDWLAEQRRQQEAAYQQEQERRRQQQEQTQAVFNNLFNMWSQMNNPGGNNRSSGGNPSNSGSASSADNKNSLCSMQGADVKGVWNTTGRWYSCLEGVNLMAGIPGKTGGRKVDCPVSNWPPKFQRTKCSATRGKCSLNFIALESKVYGSAGYLKKGEQVCGYLY